MVTTGEPAELEPAALEPAELGSAELGSPGPAPVEKVPPGMVRVRYRKYDGSAHRDYPAQRLAEDAHGTWLGVHAGTVSIYHGRPSVERIPFVLLIPRDSWWTAMFNPPPRTSEVYCDITSPAQWQGGELVDLIDLDLDVVRRRGTGRVELLDEDEFAANRVSFGYPDDLVAPARSAAAWLRGVLADGTQPFASAYHTFLAQVDGQSSGHRPPADPIPPARGAG